MQSTNSSAKTTIGILYCGDMGSAFAKLLHNGGLRVVTTCEGRSRTTQEQALASGVEILPSLNDVVAQSHVVFSIVLPSAAVDVARQYAGRHSVRPRDSVFIDANSIGMETIAEIERLMSGLNIPLVYASFHGLAHRLEDLSVLHVSGPEARSVEALCQDLLRVSWLGERIGSASVMKQLMSAISKGLAGLFTEVGVVAEKADMLEPFLRNCQSFYPDLMTIIERILPTYPRHAARRLGELREIEQSGRSFQLRLGMAHEAGRWVQLISSLQWEQLNGGCSYNVPTIIRSVANACPHENLSSKHRRFE